METDFIDLFTSLFKYILESCISDIRLSAIDLKQTKHTSGSKNVLNVFKYGGFFAGGGKMSYLSSIWCTCIQVKARE